METDDTEDKPARLSRSKRLWRAIKRAHEEIDVLQDLVSELLGHLAAGSPAQRATAARVRGPGFRPPRDPSIFP